MLPIFCFPLSSLVIDKQSQYLIITEKAGRPHLLQPAAATASDPFDENVPPGPRPNDISLKREGRDKYPRRRLEDRVGVGETFLIFKAHKQLD